MPAIVGYARVSTSDQDLAGQKHRVQAAGACCVFEDVISGKSLERPGLAELLNYPRPGDTLTVVRLDRLGRSLRELLDIVDALKKREVALLSLEEKLETSSAAGELIFHVFGALAQFERPHRRAHPRRHECRPCQREPSRTACARSGKLDAALLLVKGGMSPTKAAPQTGLGHSTLYREIQARDRA